MKVINSDILVNDVTNWKNNKTNFEFKIQENSNSETPYFLTNKGNSKFTMKSLVKLLSSNSTGQLKLKFPDGIKYEDGEKIKVTVSVYKKNVKPKRALDITFNNEGNYISHKEYNVDSDKQPVQIKFNTTTNTTYWEVFRDENLLGYIYDESGNKFNASWPAPLKFSKEICVKDTNGKNLEISGEVEFIDKFYIVGEGKLNKGTFESIKNEATEKNRRAVVRLKMAFFEELRKYQTREYAFEDIKNLKDTSVSTLAGFIYKSHNLESNKKVRDEFDKYCNEGKGELTVKDFEFLISTKDYSMEMYALVYLYMLNENRFEEAEKKAYKNHSAQQQNAGDSLNRTLVADSQSIQIKFNTDTNTTYWEVFRDENLLGYIYDESGNESGNKSGNKFNASWPAPQIFSKEICIKKSENEQKLDISGKVNFVDPRDIPLGEGELNHGKFENIKTTIEDAGMLAVCKFKILFFKEFKKYKEQKYALDDIKNLNDTSASAISEKIIDIMEKMNQKLKTNYTLKEFNNYIKDKNDKFEGKDANNTDELDKVRNKNYAQELDVLFFLLQQNAGVPLRQTMTERAQNTQQQGSNLNQTLGGHKASSEPTYVDTLESAFKELDLHFKGNNNKKIPPEINKEVLLKMMEDDLICAKNDDGNKQYSNKGYLRRWRVEKDNPFSNLRYLIFETANSLAEKTVTFNKDGSIYDLNFFAMNALRALNDNSSKKIFDMYDRYKKLCEMKKDISFEDTIVTVTDAERLSELEKGLANVLKKSTVIGTSSDTSTNDTSNGNEDVSADRMSEVILVYKELQELYKIAKILNLTKEKTEFSKKELYGIAATCVQNNSISNFLKTYFEKSAITKLSTKISGSGLTLEDRLNLLKRFLLRTKKKQGFAVTRGLHKFYKIATGDESIKVKKCFEKAGKYITGTTSYTYKNYKKCFKNIGVNGYFKTLDQNDFKNNFAAKDKTCLTRDRLMAMMFASFIGLKNETNIIAACNGLKVSGIKKNESGDNPNYIKIRKDLKAMCTSPVPKEKLVNFLRKSCCTKLGLPVPTFTKIIKLYENAWEEGAAPFLQKQN